MNMDTPYTNSNSNTPMNTMDVTYVAAVYPRFNGLYYTVRYIDQRGGDLEPNDIGNAELVGKDLQIIIDQMVKDGKPIPEPTKKSYSNFVSTYDNEIHYIEVTVKVPT